MMKSKTLKLASTLEKFFYITIFVLIIIFTIGAVASKFFMDYALMYKSATGNTSVNIPWLNIISIILASFFGISTSYDLEKSSIFIFNTIINVICIFFICIYDFLFGIIVAFCVLPIELLKIIGKFNQERINKREENKNEFDRENL